MRSKFKWIFTLLLAFSMQFSFAQEKTITGTVTEGGLPLPGVSVVVKGTTRGTQTDMDGKYAIKAKAGEVLVFSFIGMSDQVVTVGAGGSVNVTMKVAATEIEGVVVLGYDKKATKAKSTAASTTVTSETLKNRPNATVLQSLQGAAPGMTVSTSSGSPGSAKIDLLVRGVGSINSATEPLYVVDGIAANSVVFRNINPEDIESISVLRDAIATSIYGNRGANGVIVIETKKGKYESGLKISYSNSVGFSFLPKEDYNVANSQEALRIEREWGYGAGNGDNPFFNTLGRANDPVTGLPYVGVMTDQEIASYSTTDWRKVYFKGGGITQNHNLSLTNGGKNVNSFSSIGYTNQEGIVPTTDFNRFTFRNNLTGKSNNERLTYGSSFTVGYSRRHQLDQETNAGINNNSLQNPLQGSLMAVPYFTEDMYPGNGQALYDQIGTTFDYGNSALVLRDVIQQGNVPNRISDIKILGNFNASYKLTSSLTATTKFGVDFTDSQRIFARAPWAYLSIAVRESNGVPYGGFERRTTDKDFGFNSITSLSYSKVFKEKHTLDVGAYIEYVKAHRTFSQQQQNGLDLKTYAFGAGTGWSNVGATYPGLRPTVLGFKADAGTLSYFGTLGYEYDGKYGIDAVVRRDASYRFVDDFTWGTFWSVGGRWNIDRENFMQNSIFTMLKLRGSYGTQGNQNIQSPDFGVNPLYLGNNLVRDLVGLGTGYGNTGAYVLSQLGNTSLQWEEQTMANIGLDFEVFNRRFSGNFDVYNRKTDLLFNDINLSAVVGNERSMDGNNGSLVNKGVEVALRYKIFKDSPDFKLDVYANGSYNKNEIINVERTVVNDDRILESGSMVYEYYVVPYVGVNPANGNLLFLDINGNEVENTSDADRRRSGKSATPVYQGGFGFEADYKGFFLDAQFSWVKDVWRYDYNQLWLNSPSFIGDSNVSANLLNAWTPTNTDTNVPSLSATNFSQGSDYSDMWLKDASYLRMKNVSLGYSFDEKALKRTFMTGLKIYAQGENLYTWTKWKGFDADSSNDANLGSFPSPRTISVGLNVEF